MFDRIGPWEKIGVIGVDAGLVWIGDPCYIAEGLPGKEWDAFCALMEDRDVVQFKYQKGHDGLGMCVSSGYGDGLYPVYAKFDKEGRVMQIKVDFT